MDGRGRYVISEKLGGGFFCLYMLYILDYMTDYTIEEV